jgi:phosphatidylglycerophosphate synthase
MVSIKYLWKNSRRSRNPGVLGDHLLDWAGVILAKLLISMGITPNQITLGGILIGLIGISLISFSSFFIATLGYILLLFYWVTDYTDGVVARYYNIVSDKGNYYDNIGHFVTPFIFLAVGIHIFNNYGYTSAIIMGAITSIIFLSIDTNTKIISSITKKKEQAYLKISGKSLKKRLLTYHKRITFCMHIIVFFFCAEILTFLFKINFNYYLLIFYLVVFIVTLLLQIFIYSQKLTIPRSNSE